MARPDKLAIASPEAELSYSDFEARSDDFAKKLHAGGLRTGMKTVLMIKPGIDLYVMAFALFKVGAIPIVVDPGMGLGRILRSYRSAEAEAFIGIPVAHAIRRLAPRFFKGIKVLAWLDAKGLRVPKSDGALPSASAPYAIAPSRADDLALITFTTGSTGPAKAVEANYGMVMAIVSTVEERFEITPDDVDMVTAPLFGIVSLTIGATVVIPKMNPSKPADVDPETIIDTIHRYKVNSMFASPALLDKVGAYAAAHKITMPTLQTVNSGGAPATFSILRNFWSAMRPDAYLYTGWGATEGLPLAALDCREIFGSLQTITDNGGGSALGRAMPGVAIRIIRTSSENVPNWSNDLEVPRGTIGELVVSGANISRSYHKNSEANAAFKIHEGSRVWHRTGDLGWIDDDNRIFFSGRKAHSFISGSKTYHSVACEGVANAHPRVKRSACVSACGTPVVCIELRTLVAANQLPIVADEIRQLLHQVESTADISQILFHRRFPVDLRHNAKIERAVLSKWAEAELSGLAARKRRRGQLLKIIPILGWLYIIYGLVFDLPGPLWEIIWWIDLFLSVIVHLIQIPRGIAAGHPHGYNAKESAVRTFIFGATWWRPLEL